MGREVAAREGAWQGSSPPFLREESSEGLTLLPRLGDECTKWQKWSWGLGAVGSKCRAPPLEGRQPPLPVLSPPCDLGPDLTDAPVLYSQGR